MEYATCDVSLSAGRYNSKASAYTYLHKFHILHNTDFQLTYVDRGSSKKVIDTKIVLS